MNLFTKQKQTHSIENKLMVTREETGWERNNLGVWDQQIQTTIYKTDKQDRHPCTHSTGNCIQYLVINYTGKECEKEYVCVCVYI